jgi:hypothetical protein
MFSLERLNILLLAYNQSKRIGLHNTTQTLVLDAATEFQVCYKGINFK